MTNEIKSFFDYFRRVSEYYQKRLTPKKHFPAAHEFLAAKMACCALLDTLSMGVYPNKTPGEKFREFVRQFSTYGYWNRVSIPQLHYGLQHCGDHTDETRKLKSYVENRLALRNEYAIKDDPTCDELIATFPDKRTFIEKRTHLSLFYQYRCTLVHEMRQPGSGYESESTLEPCYPTQIQVPGGRLTFQLTYPLPFFFKVCDECIEKLEQYFLQKQGSPFVAYEKRFGDAWVRP